MKVKFGSGKWNMNRLRTAVGGQLLGSGERSFAFVTQDSREASETDLFIAMRGERVDGNRFVGSISGVCCYLAETVPESFDREAASLLTVTDTGRALLELCRYYREEVLSDCRVYAVTGSVGKTTTKEMLSAVLSERDTNLRKTEGNHNSLIGMPLSVLEMPEHTATAVLEMGMSARGEISELSRAVKPDIAIITNVGSSHLSTLGSRENICRAKCEILDGMGKNGILFYNGDEPLLRNRLRLQPCQTVTFGLGKENDYFAANIHRNGLDTCFDLIHGNVSVCNLQLPGVGMHLVYAALIASAVALENGFSEQEIRNGLKRYLPVGMRQNLLHCGELKILADCYNASPESMRCSAQTLAEWKDQLHLPTAVLLGDMLDLGEHSGEYHRQIGRCMAESGIDWLVAVGDHVEEYREGAVCGGLDQERIRIFPGINSDNSRLAAEFLKEMFEKSGLILVKGSRGVHLEDAVEVFMGDGGEKE